MRIPSNILLAAAVISVVTIPVFFSEYLTERPEVEYSTIEDLTDEGTGAEYKMATIYLDTAWDDIGYMLHDMWFVTGLILMIFGIAAVLRIYGRGETR
jgi:hypothetical protein